jgi:O-acetyl-ADP-ribose deacetylase
MVLSQFNGIDIEAVQGNITGQRDVKAIVNAANAWLRSGDGVAGAIHQVAGPELEKECRPHAPIRPGNAVLTAAYNLPNEYVIHCLGPVYGQDEPADVLLSDCYRNALFLAEEHNIESVAFPAISTGAFGYPVKAATKIALKSVSETAEKLKAVRKVRFVLFSKKDLKVYQRKIRWY